jgi:hypothetical protein
MYKLTDLYKQLKEEETVTPPTPYKLYCDMDGVLTDFDSRFKFFANMKPEVYEAKYGTDKFWNLIDNKIGVRFWTGMEWMPEGEKLWDYIKKYKPTLLSAPSRQNESRFGKRLWVKNNLPGFDLILANAAKKQNYSGKNKILIDDRKDNIEQWKSKGGIGILFQSTDQVINDLKQYEL